MHFCCTFCFVFMKPTFFIAVPYVESENSTNVVTLLNIHIQWVSIATCTTYLRVRAPLEQGRQN